jgi:hypothetical protein
MAKVEKEKGKEEKGSGHYSSHFPFFINTLYYQTYNTGGIPVTRLFRLRSVPL